MSDLRYIVNTLITEHFLVGQRVPFKTTYRWGVFDTEQNRWLKVYKAPLISRMVATRLANKLNKALK